MASAEIEPSIHEQKKAARLEKSLRLKEREAKIAREAR